MKNKEKEGKKKKKNTEPRGVLNYKEYRNEGTYKN